MRNANEVNNDSVTESENFVFSSSIAADVWHPNDAPQAYEWWYFDAVSDDGRDALVVIFLDNFVFSPRYNSLNSKFLKENFELAASYKFPAVTFCLYRDGKPVYRAINEFTPNDFSADTKNPACNIGDSNFQFEKTPYGARYLINVSADLRGGRKLRASLEWLAVEADFTSAANETPPTLRNKHLWNLVSPRSDVTGKIEAFERNGKLIEVNQFRGTGYHDHNYDSRWLPATVAEWQWGRAHFADATAVFYRYREIGAANAITQLFTVRAEKLFSDPANFAETGAARHLFGLKYPKQISFSTNENALLTVAQTRVIDASFFYLRFLSEMKLDLGDGKTRQTTGITEHLAPRSLKWRSLDWLINMRIGRGGRGAFLP